LNLQKNPAFCLGLVYATCCFNYEFFESRGKKTRKNCTGNKKITQSTIDTLIFVCTILSERCVALVEDGIYALTLGLGFRYFFTKRHGVLPISNISITFS
jgi:hypothetical protein